MPQLNEYSIEELTVLHYALADLSVDFNDKKKINILLEWNNRIIQAISDREFTDSQLPFRTPKEINSDK